MEIFKTVKFELPSVSRGINNWTFKKSGRRQKRRAFDLFVSFIAGGAPPVVCFEASQLFLNIISCTVYALLTNFLA
ncbi:hypothetical protein A6770_20640 [Nostoc minutum NIES-26]|uniref:Uncharacterized protein n=1 Tax=Nostoc minutum NIES-26 TaxID=1844469 RepID=A0A367R5N0_9NOSO|nr:hypothetical protein A6770_20640 [Nostoc minutum NIES-26]